MNYLGTISEFLGLHPETFRMVLKGKRNLSFKKAKKLGSLLKCDLNIWQDPDRISERQEVWARYTQEEAA